MTINMRQRLTDMKQRGKQAEKTQPGKTAGLARYDVVLLFFLVHKKFSDRTVWHYEICGQMSSYLNSA